MKKILITGATGFVGSAIARELCSKNYEVHTLIRNTSKIFRLKDIQDKLSFHHIDLSDCAALELLAKKEHFDTIFHFATYGGFEYEKDSHEILETNVVGLDNLLNIFSKYGLKTFFNASSSSEYGIKSYPMKEDDQLDPISLYGISKVSATNIAQFYFKNKGINVITIRLFSPYGYFDGKTRLIPTVIRGALLKERITLKCLLAVRDYIFIEDVLDFFRNLISIKESVQGEIFNLGSGKQCRVGEVVQKILQIIGQPDTLVSWSLSDLSPNESKIWVADMTKTLKLTGWKSKISLDEGLEKTINWFKENIALYK